MANTQELMLKIRGDNTDVEKKLHQTSNSVDGIKTTTEKASSAMKGFGRDLLQVRDVSDLASAATRALGSAIAGSLAGTAVIVAGQAVIDAYRKVQNAAKESEKAILEARKSVEQIGGASGIDVTASAAKRLFDEAEKVSEKLKEIEANKLQSFIASLTDARAKMSQLVVETEKQAKALERQGIVNTLIDLERNKNLSETDKAIQQIAAKYKPVIDAARQSGDAELLNVSILQQQKEVQGVISREKDARAAEDKKIAEQRAKFDQDSATENELNEIRRMRNLERTREELQRQVKVQEKLIEQENTMTQISEDRARFERSGGVYSGKGGATTFDVGARSKRTGSFDKAILMSSRPGQQALDVARKQRGRQVSKEDFRTQNALFEEEAKRLSAEEGRTLTKQDVRNRMAKRAAAGEMPTLGERLQGSAAGIEPAQVARGRSEKQMGSEGKSIPDLLAKLDEVLNKITSAPLVTSGSGSN